MYRPRYGVTFYFNGERTITITSVEFARKYLNIWLSEKTSEPRLREKLLAGNS
jgi:hypothetical protein